MEVWQTEAWPRGRDAHGAHGHAALVALASAIATHRSAEPSHAAFEEVVVRDGQLRLPTTGGTEVVRAPPLADGPGRAEHDAASTRAPAYRASSLDTGHSWAILSSGPIFEPVQTLPLNPSRREHTLCESAPWRPSRRR